MAKKKEGLKLNLNLFNLPKKEKKEDKKRGVKTKAKAKQKGDKAKNSKTKAAVSEKIKKNLKQKYEIKKKAEKTKETKKQPIKPKPAKSSKIEKKPKTIKKVKKEKEIKSHEEAIEKILEGIKEIEYAPQKRKIAEKEPHIEHIITPKSEFKEDAEIKSILPESFIPSKKEDKKVVKLEKEIKKVSYAAPETEIQTIKTLATIKKPRVETEKPKLIKTGIPGFDEMCGGGIEEKSVVLINGDAGSGKTVFGLQFLYEAAKNGEAGLFISFGESRETIYSRMLNFGMDFQKLEDKNLFFFLEYQPHEVAKIMQEEGGTLYDIITSYNIKRVVVDTITPYLMQFSDPYKARLALVRLFSVFKKFNVTTLLLNEWSSDLPSNPSTAVAEFLADGIVYIIHKRSPEGVQLRGIEIWKMTGVSHTEVARPFAFTNRGIVIYPNERLFFGSSERKL
ncbi:MAG: ATPase domain-containing protein [Candidatus Micrarchaeia archaeon]